MPTALLIIALATALATAAGTGWIRRQALVRHWLDVPNARSSHAAPMPKGGGAAIVAATLCAFILLTLMDAMSVRLGAALAVGGLAVAVVGFIDDRRPLPASTRLLVHIAAAAWAVGCLGGVPAVRFGDTSVEFGALGFVLGVLAIGWTINLFNFMDGIDGLAASEGAFIAAAGAWLGAGATAVGVPAGAAVVAAACAGFLVWNWPPARIFMGDVGSGYVGYVIAVLALAAMWHSDVALFVWLALGAVFFVDATVTLVRRLLRREALSEAHRTHAYQWLARTRLGHLGVTICVLVLNIAVLLPIAAYCLARPEHAALVTGAAFAALAATAVLLGSGRAT